MIICRKCQRQHPDEVGAGPCPCGADLRRDGIRVASTNLFATGEDLADESDGGSLPPLDTDEQPVVPTTDPVPRGRRAESVTPGDLIGVRPGIDEPNEGAPRAGSETDAVPPIATVVDQTARVPAVDEVACPVCAEPNGASRRFCIDCGAPLPVIGEHEERDDDLEGEPRDTVWRRLTGTGIRGDRDLRTWRQRARDAGQGRLGYHAGYSMRAKAGALLAAVGLGGGAVGLAGPWRDSVADLLGGGGPSGTSPAGAELSTPADEVDGFPASSVRDGDPLTGVAVRVDPGSGIEAATVRLTLEAPMTIRSVHVAPGLPDAVEDGPLFLRPRTVRMCADSGSCQEIVLSESTSLQSRAVSLGEGVRFIDLTVLDVHPSEVTTYPLAVISEVRVDS